MTHCQRVAQFENDTCAREWHDFPDKIDIHCAIFPQECVDLLQLVLDLARVAPRQQDKKIERVVLKLEFSFFRALSNDFSCFFFPTGASGVEPIKNLQLCSFNQQFVKPAPL